MIRFKVNINLCTHNKKLVAYHQNIMPLYAKLFIQQHKISFLVELNV
jgi:hypothetical protein